MNEILLSSLICLFIIGIIALGIFINFYFEKKRKLFIFYIPGWIIYSLGYLTPIFSELTLDITISQILLVIHGIFIEIGIFLIGIGAISYFTNVSLKFVMILCVFYICLPLVLYLTFGVGMALNFSFIAFSLSVVSALIAPISKWGMFKRMIKKNMILYFIDIAVLIFYIPVMILIFLNGYNFGLFDSNDSFLIILNYLTVITGTILTTFYFVQLEFSISNQEKFNLKDKFSHNMGNILQTIIFSIELLKTEEKLEDKERLELIKTIEKKVDEVCKLLEEIREIK
ncbi:MAG: hypothetical protein EAX96_13010 [Candidatus Lokiarchaeota archaeon]|nr:hypothetical protein [Candidatus Lokiarchaeota archaeon]